MTKEEAIGCAKNMTYQEAVRNTIYAKGIRYKKATRIKLHELAEIADKIDTAEPNKAVPPSLADVYKWERDIALSQLEEYGIGFAEKKRDDLVEVVRCKDCRFAEHGTAMEMGEINKTPKHYIDWIKCHNYDRHKGVLFVKDDDFCSYGERREP